MPSQPDTTRRRHLPSPITAIPPGTKQINAAPLLDNPRPAFDRDDHLTSPRLVVWGAMIYGAVPALLGWGWMLGLIFGGCCSNVYALEAIVKEEPESGMLITFAQFLVTALLTWPAHFSASNPPFFLKPRAIPIRRWLPTIVLFFSTNALNNYAFGFDISVPVHIILRSGGSVTTMIVGFLWGKRYTRAQIFSVVLLTIGVIGAAIADARAKGKIKPDMPSSSPGSSTKNTSSVLTGLFILALAQVLGAILGLYTQITYQKYGSHWQENLFYSHFLALPLFLPSAPSLLAQFHQLLLSPSITLLPAWQIPTITSIMEVEKQVGTSGNRTLLRNYDMVTISPSMSLPEHLVSLALNAVTQFACINGVNLLAATTTALSVSIVLNVRKLVSLLVSIWLFGNQLPLGVLVSAAVVFASAGIWAWEGRRLGRRKG